MDVLNLGYLIYIPDTYLTLFKLQLALLTADWCYTGDSNNRIKQIRKIQEKYSEGTNKPTDMFEFFFRKSKSIKINKFFSQKVL